MDFIRSQINLTLQLIQELEPRIIIVENALVSRILNKNLKPEKLNKQLNLPSLLTWKDEIGTYRLKSGTPVFLSGMLTGGHALDLGSFERLKWHLKLVDRSE